MGLPSLLSNSARTAHSSRFALVNLLLWPHNSNNAENAYFRIKYGRTASEAMTSAINGLPWERHYD